MYTPLSKALLVFLLISVRKLNFTTVLFSKRHHKTNIRQPFSYCCLLFVCMRLSRCDSSDGQHSRCPPNHCKSGSSQTSPSDAGWRRHDRNSCQPRKGKRLTSPSEEIEIIQNQADLFVQNIKIKHTYFFCADRIKYMVLLLPAILFNSISNKM